MPDTDQRTSPAHSTTWAAAIRWPSRHGWLDAGLVIALAVPAILQLLTVLPRGYDTQMHVLRLAWLNQAFTEGWIAFPRWSAELGFGYGYPLFNFYAPAGYIPGALLAAIGLDPARAFAISLVAFAVLAALGMRTLAADVLKDVAPSQPDRQRIAALVAAIVYLYSPYFLINLHVRGAIAEVVAQAGLPWALWLMRRVMVGRDPLAYAPLAALVLAGIVFSHTISLLLIPPFVLWITLAQLKRARGRWRSALFTGLGAIGLSALFWLPLIMERDAAGTAAYRAALPADADGFLQLDTFIWAGVTYPYTRITSGLRFGLSPWLLGLSMCGLWLARRRLTPELMAYTVTLLVTGALQLDVSHGLWTLGGLIEIVQSPSRLQTMFYLSAALLSAVAVARSPAFVEVRPLAIVVIACVIGAAAPWTIRMPPLVEPTTRVGLAALANTEAVAPAFGLSIYPEFLPRWVEYPQGLSLPAEPGTTEAEIELLASGPTEYRLTSWATTSTTLRTADFYFPGWAAWVDEQPVAVSATTALGLVTLTVPAGQHTVRIAFVGSPAQNAALWLSTLTALGAAGFLGLNRRRLATLGALSLTLCGLWAILHPYPSANAATRLTSSDPGGALELLDARARVISPDRLGIASTWYVRSTADDLALHWVLRNSEGVDVAVSRGRPWFDHIHTQTWPAGTVADDQAELLLPDGLAAGDYTLMVCVQPEAQRTRPCTPAIVAVDSIPLAATEPATLAPNRRFAFGNGPDLVEAVLETPTGEYVLGGPAPVVRPTDHLVVRLLWRVQDWLTQDLLESSPILMTRQGQRLSYSTYPLGGVMTWLRSLPPGSVIVDRQPVLLDADTPGGRYPLTIRIFDRAAGTYLSVLGEDGAPGPDSVSVGEVKVLTPEGPWVGAAPRAIVGDLIEVIGYDLDPVDGVLRPGDDLTVTIVYRVSHAADRELTAFTHVYSSESGLVAQHDAPPLEGNNPSTSWVPGEVIRDVITLTLDPSSPPGPYQVMWGLYDPATGERLPLTLTDGVQPSERALMLQEIEIAGR